MLRRFACSLSVLAFTLAFAPACDGDDEGGSDEAADETGADEDDSSDDATGAEGGDEGLDSESGGGGDFGESGEPQGCAAHESEDACSAAVGCNGVYGAPLEDAGDGGWCTAEDEYIGCVNAGDLCPPLIKVLCGAEGEVWQTSECVPANLTACSPPGDITGPC